MTATERLIGFIDRSPSPYHAVDNAAALLSSKGFMRLEETEKFRLEKGKAYFAVRNSSALIAFRIPASADSFSMIAAHTDSPVLRLKHDPENAAAGCYTTLNAEIYGGMLQKPWFDRPLSIAGRVFVRNGNKI